MKTDTELKMFYSDLEILEGEINVEEDERLERILDIAQGNPNDYEGDTVLVSEIIGEQQ